MPRLLRRTDADDVRRGPRSDLRGTRARRKIGSVANASPAIHTTAWINLVVVSLIAVSRAAELASGVEPALSRSSAAGKAQLVSRPATRTPTHRNRDGHRQLGHRRRLQFRRFRSRRAKALPDPS